MKEAVYKKSSLLLLSIKLVSKKKKLLFFISSALFLYACFVIYGSFLTNVFLTVRTSSLAYPIKNFQSNVEYQNFPANIPTFKNYYSANYDNKNPVSDGLQNFRSEIGQTRFLSSNPDQNTSGSKMFNRYLWKADPDNPLLANKTTHNNEYVYPCLSDAQGNALPGYDTFNPEAVLDTKNITAANIESHYPGFLLDADKNGTHSVYDEFIKSIVAGQSLSRYFDNHSTGSTESSLVTKIIASIINNIQYIANNKVQSELDNPAMVNYASKHGYNDFLQLANDDGHFTKYNQYANLKINDPAAKNYLQIAPDADLAPFFTARCSLLLGILSGLDGNSSGLSFSNVFFQAFNDYCRYFKLNKLISNNLAFDFPLSYEVDNSSGIAFVKRVFGGLKNNKVLQGTAAIFEQGMIKNLPIYLLHQFYANKLSLNMNLLPFNPKTDCKYTHIDGSISRKSVPISTNETELWGLPLADRRVNLYDKRKHNLKPLIAPTSLESQNDVIPIVVNSTFENKYHLKVGSTFTFNHEQKENYLTDWKLNQEGSVTEKSQPADINNFLSFNNLDTLQTDGNLKIGTNTNGLFYKFENPPNTSAPARFDSLSFLYKNYQNMSSLGSKNKVGDFFENKINNKKIRDTYGMNIREKPLERDLKIVGVVNNNYYKPLMITSKQSTDFMNWGHAGHDVAASGKLFNAKLTTKGSPDDLQNFSIYNQNSDYTPVGLNGNGRVYDPTLKKFVNGNVLPFTFAQVGFDPNDNYYNNIKKNYGVNNFLVNPAGQKDNIQTDEYAELSYVNNLKRDDQNKVFGEFTGHSTSSISTLFSHDLFDATIRNTAKLITVMISVLIAILFLLVILVLGVIFRNLVMDNKKTIAILKAGGYSSFKIFKLIFFPFFICGFFAFCVSFIVTSLTAKGIFSPLFTTLNVPPIFPNMLYAFSTTVLFLLFILGAVLIMLSFYNIRKIKGQL